MIPTSFDYAAPTTIDEALQMLAASPDDTKLLAGGQSLIPVMKLRLADAEHLVDLGRIEQMRGVRMDGDRLVIGAMTEHHEVASHPLVAAHAGVLADAAASVADPQVRHRGTIGGALVHADPAGDYPAPALALDAELVITGATGTRTVPAAEFFEDYFTTAVGDDEILTEIRLPSYSGWGGRYEKFTRVAQQWSIVAVAAEVRVDGGVIAEARIGLTNMGSTPIRARGVEAALAGCAIDDGSVAEACASVAEGTSPPNDINGDADYRRHLATVLTRRAVLGAARQEPAH
ncbi:xanthine dehydrogenase family protein subunit M [Saxibacter everestensis]|uniref:Xanthine dehydrogenase family protein subunit M n=1 Tax=Saxibacter everestensis TaxID=2909229 RepID=A0ABY8QV82_9MICO|nr:xanthine dehydrogenase family protein subunit M [Brevibacteriaceae bacterium ZFBP1038]